MIHTSNEFQKIREFANHAQTTHLLEPSPMIPIPTDNSNPMSPQISARERDQRHESDHHEQRSCSPTLNPNGDTALLERDHRHTGVSNHQCNLTVTSLHSPRENTSIYTRTLASTGETNPQHHMYYPLSLKNQ